MIRTKILIVIFSPLAVFACTSAAGTEPNDANAPLTFEVSSIELPAPSLHQVRAMQSPWKGTVTYAAGVPLNRSPYFPRHGTDDMRGFVPFAQSQDISADQRRFLETTFGGLEAQHTSRRGGYDLPDFYSPPTDPNAPQLLLYAVSLEDARKMAEAYLRYARDGFKDRIGPMQEEVKQLSERLADDQQKLPGTGPAAEAAKKAFDDLEKQVPYRDDKQALDAAAELDKMLNAAQVDIAGIQAALKAIQDYQRTRRGSPAVDSKLEVMLVEESISLQGAEARKRMAVSLRKQADSYIDLKAAWQRAEGEKDRLAHDVFTLPEMIRRARQRLADKMEQEPRIIDDRVFIYPVKPPNRSPSIMTPQTRP
jgi:hypothetical protein